MQKKIARTDGENFWKHPEMRDMLFDLFNVCLSKRKFASPLVTSPRELCPVKHFITEAAFVSKP